MILQQCKAEKAVVSVPKGDGSISIVSHSFSKDNNGNDLLVLEYTWTNTADTAESFVFSVFDKVYQNGVECPLSYKCDEIDYENMWKDVQLEDTINIKMAYVLQDMTDVNVTAGEQVGGSELLDEIIELGGGKGALPADIKETSARITDHYITKNNDKDILIIESEFYNGESKTMSMNDKYNVVLFQNGTECERIYGDILPVEDTESIYVKTGYSVKVYWGFEITDISDVSVEITDWQGTNTLYLSETLSLS